MPAGRGRRIAAVAASAAIHALVLAALALHVPTLIMPPEPSAPPQPIIPILLMPRSPLAAAERQSPIRLHRRPQRFAAPPIAPLPVPPLETGKTARAGPVFVLHPAPLPQSPQADIRATLRGSEVGCANADAVHLTQAEREHCYEVFGKGAKTATFVGLGLSREKQAEFDAAAAHQEACRRYRENTPNSQSPPIDKNMPPGLGPSLPLSGGLC
jgi:hypothetical protein